MYVKRPLRANHDKLKKILITSGGHKDRKYEYRGKALHISTIDKIMEHFPWYMSVFVYDYLNADQSINKKELQKKINQASDIYNGFPENRAKGEKGKLGVILLYDYHFRSLVITPHSVEYYDAFGEEPPDVIKKFIFGIIKKLSPEVLLKYKVNKIQNQNKKTNNCGLHSIMFIINRLLNDMSFKEATGYPIAKAEYKARNLGQELKKFNYI